MTRRATPLYRTDLRQQRDRPTNSMILRHVGTGRRALDFEQYIYGYPEGTFFVASYSDVPFPERIEQLASDRGINVLALPDAPRLQDAVVEALVTEAMVKAPELLSELAVPEVRWQDWDRRELERKHTIACARVAEISRIVEVDIKLRAAGVATPSYKVEPIEGLLGPEPAYIGPGPILLPAVTELPPPALAPPVVEEEPEVEVEEEEVDERFVPGSSTVQKAVKAVEAARDAELPQRLPGGMRRRLRKMAPGRYVMYGEVIDSRVDLCAAMTDGRSLGRKGREVAVVDWDGEWPVVVRRFGQGGRTVYKVETALRRSGVEVA